MKKLPFVSENRLLRVFPYVAILLATLFTFHKIFSIFFQQDEWLGFGLMIGYGWESILGKFAEGGSFHFVPLVLAIDYILFKVFGLNSMPYNTLAILSHTLNGVLVFLIIEKLLNRIDEKSIAKNVYLALLGSIFFVTSSVASQLITWPVVNINVLSLSLTLFAWLLLLKYQANVNLTVLGFIEGILTVLALLIVEYSAGLILFIPFVFYLLFKQVKRKRGFLTTFFATVSGYFLARFIFSFLMSTQQGNSGANIDIWQLMFFPLRYFGQILVPEKVILEIGAVFSSSDALIENVFFIPIVSLIGTIVIFGVSYLLLKSKNKSNTSYEILLISIGFIVFSFLPYLFLLLNSVSFSIIPPRYLYFGASGIAILSIVIVEIFIQEKKKMAKQVLLSLTLLLIILNIYINYLNLNTLHNISIDRENMLKKIKVENPKLPNKTVFYIESDRHYYNVIFKIPPFQSGFGQTLLVWFDSQENFPEDFFKEMFLWEIGDQGYKEFNGRGFGYFREFNELKNSIKNNNLDPESVISYKINNNNLENITDEIQTKLKE